MPSSTPPRATAPSQPAPPTPRSTWHRLRWARRATVFGASLLASALVTAAPASIFVLNPINPGDQVTRAEDINRLGHAVGLSRPSDLTLAGQQASFWAQGSSTAQGLPGFAGVAGESSAQSINQHNQVVGSLNAGGVQRAVQWAPTSGPPSTPSFGAGPSALGNLGQGDHFATDINDSGAVLGSYWKCQNSDCSLGNTRSFSWNSGTGMQQVGADSGFWTHAQAINGAGDMLVANTTAGGQELATIVRQDGVAIDVPLGGSFPVFAGSMDMNDGRQIVGKRITLPDPNDPNSDLQFDAFIWSQGVETTLARLTDMGGSPLALNNAGWVVGLSNPDISSATATLWAGQMVWDLNSLLSAADQAAWDLEVAVAITDNGWIAGNGWYLVDATTNERQRRGFRMQLSADFMGGLPPNFDGGGDPEWGNPEGGGTVPTPGTLALAGLGALALVATRRRPGQSAG